MEIIIFIIIGLVCLCLGFFISKAMLSKENATLSVQVENFEKSLNDKIAECKQVYLEKREAESIKNQRDSEFSALKAKFDEIQNSHQEQLESIKLQSQDKDKQLATLNNEFKNLNHEKREIENLKNQKDSEFSALKAKFDEIQNFHQEQLDSLKLQLNTKYDSLSGLHTELKSKFNQQKEDLDQTIQKYNDLSKEFSNLETSLNEREKSFAEQRTSFDKQKEELSSQFKALANDILDAKAISLQETSKVGISAIMNPFQQALEGFKKEVHEIHHRETQQQGEIRQELTQLKELNQKITQEAHDLATALRGQKKMQGNWGELILENVLERSGLQLGKDFQREVSVSTDDAKLRPDVVVYLPQNKHLIVDSKVSLNAYTNYINAENEQDRTLSLQQHIKAISERINDLSSKEYYKTKELNSPEIVFMFIPIESAFVEAFRADDTIFQKALEKNILVATPTTLLTSLNIVRQLWRFEDQNKHTALLASKADDVFQKLRVFLGSFQDIKKALDKANESYTKAEGQLVSGRGNLIKQVNEFKTLAPSITNNLPLDLVEKANLEIEYLSTADNK